MCVVFCFERYHTLCQYQVLIQGTGFGQKISRNHLTLLYYDCMVRKKFVKHSQGQFIWVLKKNKNRKNIWHYFIPNLMSKFVHYIATIFFDDMFVF